MSCGHCHTPPEPVVEVRVPGRDVDYAGKVRDIFREEGRLLLVATDRISAYDVVLPNGIPGKGIVLTQLSRFWFEKLGDVCPNHLITCDLEQMPELYRREELRGRTMLVEALEMIPFECVVRGYLAGSAWREYQETGAVCGIELPPGLQKAGKLERPIFTPATKAQEGHDINVARSALVEELGETLTARLEEASITLYEQGASHAAGCGLILADTKFEFGLQGGEVVLADEVLSSDSSRYWDAASWSPGEQPVDFDKQYVRDHLDRIGWDRQPPVPELPPEVVEGTSERYIEAYRRLTGEAPPF
jgi:phosphoribosylaminoimidazole-succinocarboxamide synthase